eukprot:13050017-Heterocapsa_arctica.AAC.1
MSKVERKKLSRLGAVRISRKQAIRFVQSRSPTQQVYTLLAGYSMDGQENCLGYILYQDLGNKPYAKTLIKCIANEEAKWLKENNKGDLMECILALGYLYQTGKCDALEGIMDLVVFLENKLAEPANEEDTAQVEADNVPITTT